jgi:murein DD-endopeptidase MepM/ murein hydrolase activator NlpD
MVHSFAYNAAAGDYGATIILQHQIEMVTFYTLYGHLSLDDIAALRKGMYITRGQCVGHFGQPNENGNWPPHLHFQIIKDLYRKEGDFPGVCTPADAALYLNNSPQPDLILQLNQFL